MINHIFSQREQDLRDLIQVLVSQTLDEVIAPHIDAFSKLPETWFPLVTQAGLTVEGERFCVVLSQGRRVPHWVLDSWISSKHSDTVPKVVTAYKRLQAVTVENRSVRQKIATQLRTFTTNKKLKEGWPEAFEFLPEHLKKGEKETAPPPAPQLKEINVLLSQNKQKP
jgi:hypothetical protein